MIDELVKRVEEKKARHVLVDACVARAISHKLKWLGFEVRHVCDINSQLPDEEIEKLMKPDEILITKDYEFAIRLGHRAILMPFNAEEIKKEKAMKIAFKRARLPKTIRQAVQENVRREADIGLLQLKIILGIFMVFEIRVFTMEEVRRELLPIVKKA